MNKKLPFVPNETDAILYVIISVLLLMSVNQVLSKPMLKKSKYIGHTNIGYLPSANSEKLYFFDEHTHLFLGELNETQRSKNITVSAQSSLVAFTSTLKFSAITIAVCSRLVTPNRPLQERSKRFDALGNVWTNTDVHNSGGRLRSNVFCASIRGLRIICS